MNKKKMLALVNDTRDRRVSIPRSLTKRQREILDFIKLHRDKFGFSPTRQEIADAFGLWVNGVQQHLYLIQKKGFITMDLRAARAIQILEVA